MNPVSDEHRHLLERIRFLPQDKQDEIRRVTDEIIAAMKSTTEEIASVAIQLADIEGSHKA